jgi:hypothetical protein
MLAAAGQFLVAASNPVATAGGRAFPSADAAAQALVNAAKADDATALIEILGPSSKDIVVTRDPVADRKIRRDFAARASQKIRLIPYHGRANEKTLLAGKDEWPLPIPIVESGGKWYFDTAQARQEILNRRIGGNELDAIEVCRGYVEAQNAYAADHATQAGVPFYAQKVISSPGERDGLYWAGKPGVDESLMGRIIARAFAEGYTKRGEPYHGYYFKVLTGQGPDVSGGEMSYIDNGVMTKGYALVAWPANYGSTGIMTFLVDKTGIVYQKNLGHRTKEIASAFSAYNPDNTWKPVSEPRLSMAEKQMTRK